MTDHDPVAFCLFFFFFQAEDGIRDLTVTGVQTCALPISFPFVMNTGRQLYHWHTGTMTRRATGLDQREPTPIMEIHPADAAALGLADGDPARVTSRRNSLVISCRISERVARGQVFVPFHFREAAANLLTNPVLDPYAKMTRLL